MFVFLRKQHRRKRHMRGGLGSGEGRRAHMTEMTSGHQFAPTLAPVTCTLCKKQCPLSNPGCGRGAALAAQQR